MGKYLIDETTLTNIANSIREKSGKTESISVDEFANEINNIETGGDDPFEGHPYAHLHITYSVDSGLSSGFGDGLTIDGFKLNDLNKVEKFMYQFDGGTNGDFYIKVPLNTAMSCYYQQGGQGDDIEWVDNNYNFSVMSCGLGSKIITVPETDAGGISNAETEQGIIELQINGVYAN